MPQDPREAFYHERVRECGANYNGFDRLSSEAALNLAYTYDLLHQVTSRYIAEFGLSKSSFNVLMILKHGDAEGMLLHNLGELLLVSRANVTGLVDHLEQKGLVKRVVDEQDRRARFARITPAGLAMLDRVAPVHFRALTELMSGLSDAEKQQLIALLEKTRSSVSERSASVDGLSRSA